MQLYYARSKANDGICCYGFLKRAKSKIEMDYIIICLDLIFLFVRVFSPEAEDETFQYVIRGLFGTLCSCLVNDMY